MTVVVGIVESGKVYIGSDSQVSSGDYRKQYLAEGKVFQIKGATIGVCGYLRDLNALRSQLKLPIKFTKSDEKYIYKHLANSIKKLVEDGELYGRLLIGYNGKLFEMGSDYSVSGITDNYMAIGSGEEYALASLYTLYKHTPDMPVKDKITCAIESASSFCPSVGGKIHIKVQKK